MVGMPVPVINMLITNKVARPFRANTPKYLAVHWTGNTGEGADADNNARYFQKGERAASAHYVVDDHQIVRCIPEGEVAYSVGARSYTAWAVSHIGGTPNNKVISVEMCVNSDGQFWKMYSNTAYLCADILLRHGWGVDRLIRHNDVTGKVCPAFFVGDMMARKYTGRPAGAAWSGFRSDVERVMKLLKKQRHTSGVPSTPNK